MRVVFAAVGLDNLITRLLTKFCDRGRGLVTLPSSLVCLRSVARALSHLSLSRCLLVDLSSAGSERVTGFLLAAVSSTDRLRANKVKITRVCSYTN